MVILYSTVLVVWNSHKSNSFKCCPMEISSVYMGIFKIYILYELCNQILFFFFLRDSLTTLCQLWTVALKCEELNYLIHLLLLCGNEIHIPVSSQKDVLEQAGKVLTQNAEQKSLHLYCDKDPHQLTDLLMNTVSSWLPHINSLR